MGLQSFFVFYGPSGIVSAACTTGITIQREVRESSDRPTSPSQTYPTFTCPLLLRPLATLVLSSICSLYSIFAWHHLSALFSINRRRLKKPCVCFGFIWKMMVIAAPASDLCYDIIFCNTILSKPYVRLPGVAWDLLRNWLLMVGPPGTLKVSSLMPSITFLWNKMKSSALQRVIHTWTSVFNSRNCSDRYLHTHMTDSFNNVYVCDEVLCLIPMFGISGWSHDWKSMSFQHI